MNALIANRRLGNGLGFIACVGLMAYALFCQYVLKLVPCPLCIFQRMAVITVGLIFLVAAVHNPRAFGARIYGALLVLAAVLGMGVSARHIWIQAQPPGSVPACGADLNFLLDIMPIQEVITKVLTGSGECGKIDWMFLGLTMPMWVLISLVALATWAAIVNFRR